MLPSVHFPLLSHSSQRLITAGPQLRSWSRHQSQSSAAGEALHLPTSCSATHLLVAKLIKKKKPFISEIVLQVIDYHLLNVNTPLNIYMYLVCALLGFVGFLRAILIIIITYKLHSKCSAIYQEKNRNKKHIRPIESKGIYSVGNSATLFWGIATTWRISPPIHPCIPSIYPQPFVFVRYRITSSVAFHRYEYQ